MRYEYWKTRNGVWHWHLKEGLGEIVGQSEGYPDRTAVLRAIDLDRPVRPDGAGIRRNRRYRLSFASLMALAVAAGLSWLAAYSVLPRWDEALVATDADVVARGADGSGRQRTSWVRLGFRLPDGKQISTVVFNRSVDFEATKVRIRYRPDDPKDVHLEDDSRSFVFAFAMLIAAAAFVVLAYKSSLHDGERHFM